MDLGIRGRWALVCGASQGLGFGCAQALAAEGVHLVMVARRADVLQASAQAIQNQYPDVTVLTVAQDITQAAGQARALNAPGGPMGAFDILITNAGGPPPGDFRQWDEATWHTALNANMLTPIALMKALVDGMAERGFGRVINITSGAVKAPIEHLGLSNGARAGLTGFVAGLARSGLAAKGVTINNLLPGAFDTDRLQTTLRAAANKLGKQTEELAQQRRAGIPAQRFGTAAEFGAICAFLCSQQAAYLTGQNILADGGAYPGTF